MYSNLFHVHVKSYTSHIYIYIYLVVYAYILVYIFTHIHKYESTFTPRLKSTNSMENLNSLKDELSESVPQPEICFEVGIGLILG